LRRCIRQKVHKVDDEGKNVKTCNDEEEEEEGSNEGATRVHLIYCYSAHIAGLPSPRFSPSSASRECTSRLAWRGA